MKKVFPFIILTVISVFLIFYRFADIPKYLSFDEVEFTKLALSLDDKPYIPYSQLATGHSTLYFYILLVSLKIFGINTFALRLPSAIFGILSVIIFYLILKNIYKNNEIFDTKYLILNTLILLSSHWFLNFARFSFEATFLLFLELTSIYFLMLANVKVTNFLRLGIPRFLRGGFPLELKNLLPSISSSFYIILSGIFAGLAFLSYTPGRIFFLLPIGFLILKWYRQGNALSLHKNEIIKQILLLIIPFIIIITPLTSYLSKNMDTRIDQQFFLRNHEMPIQEKFDGLWHNISSTALMFNIKGDVNGRHNYPGKPALNPILGILFIVGLVLTMKSVFAKASTFDKSSADKSTDRQWNIFFLIYFFLSIFPALMTYPWENPNMLRTYTVLPSVAYFIGNVIIVLHTTALKLIKNKNKLFRLLILNTLYFILIFSCLYELRTYFKYQSEVFTHSFQIKLPLEKAIKMKIKI